MSFVKYIYIFVFLELVLFIFVYTMYLFQVACREEKIKQLQDDLLESQSQHSACYNEVSYTPFI